MFERTVTRRHRDGSTSVGRIDLYRRKSFVLEAKQGSQHLAQQASLLGPAPRLRRGTAVRGTSGWDDAMVRARFQAEAYAKDRPVEEGWPSFLVVVDVGHSIELYADFSQTGKAYVPFPDAGTHRIFLENLTHSLVRERLRKVWLQPLDLDPARVTARVTRHVAEQLAELAKALEVDHEPEAVAAFLMRCIFTSFAEDGAPGPARLGLRSGCIPPPARPCRNEVRCLGTLRRFSTSTGRATPRRPRAVAGDSFSTPRRSACAMAGEFGGRKIGRKRPSLEGAYSLTARERCTESPSATRNLAVAAHAALAAQPDGGTWSAAGSDGVPQGRAGSQPASAGSMRLRPVERALGLEEVIPLQVAFLCYGFAVVETAGLLINLIG